MKGIMLLAALLIIQFVHAGNHVIVIKDSHSSGKGNTEVTIGGTTDDGDVITIVPGDGTTTITVTVKDTAGNVLWQGEVPATAESSYEFTTPNLPDGCLMEISDNQSVVYFDNGL